MMRTWSLSLGLALICCSASVQGQSCSRDTDCDSGKCCLARSGRPRTCSKWTCECENDSDCKFALKCHSLYRLCAPPFLVLSTFSIPTSDPTTYSPVLFNPKNYCKRKCSITETCKNGQCVSVNYHNNDKDQTGSGGSSWSGGRIVAIVLFGVVGSIISYMYYVCKRNRRLQTLPSRNVNLNTPPTDVVRGEGNYHEMQSRNAAATNRTIVGIVGNDHEMQSGNAAAAITNITAVEAEDDALLPPHAPPPYNSLEFESEQNGNRNFTEQPPPSYNEAVRNPAVP